MTVFSAPAAARMTRLLAGAGPRVSKAQARALVEEIRGVEKIAADTVLQVSGMTALTDRYETCRMFIVDRPRWAAAMADYADHIEHLTRGPLPEELKDSVLFGSDDAPGSVAVSHVITAVTGGALSWVSRRILGHYDSVTNKLYVVAPNVQRLRDLYNLDRHDVAVWVIMHERTHALQFSAAPWLREHIETLIASVAENEHKDDDAAAADYLETVRGVMSLLEGHAEWVMDQAPLSVVPSRKRMREAFDDRRSQSKENSTGPLATVVAKAEQYVDGREFVEAVVDQRGLEFFNRIWSGPHMMPSAAEIDDPQAWISRIDQLDSE